MKKIISTTLITLSLAGCSNIHPVDEQVSTINSVMIDKKIIPKKIKNQPYQLSDSEDPAVKAAFQKFMTTGRAKNIITDGFIKFAYNMGAQPIIKTQPLQATVLSLEPGEKFTNISSGDPNRWSYSVAVSGSGIQQQHILIKPSESDLSTNMIITTDRRIYNVGLVAAHDNELSRQVSFWYPEMLANNVNQQASEENERIVSDLPNLDLKNLNFNYKIANDWFSRNPTWKPERVFDDGTHTYIQFPHAISSQNLPAIFTLDGHQKSLVNYRVKLPYVMIDQVFKHATLITGSSMSQTRVTITNQNYR